MSVSENEKFVFDTYGRPDDLVSGPVRIPTRPSRQLIRRNTSLKMSRHLQYHRRIGLQIAKVHPTALLIKCDTLSIAKSGLKRLLSELSRSSKRVIHSSRRAVGLRLSEDQLATQEFESRVPVDGRFRLFQIADGRLERRVVWLDGRGYACAFEFKSFIVRSRRRLCGILHRVKLVSEGEGRDVLLKRYLSLT